MTTSPEAPAENPTTRNRFRSAWILAAILIVVVAAVIVGGAGVLKNYTDDSFKSSVDSMQKSISDLGLEVDKETAQRVSDGCRSEDWFKPTSATIIKEINGKKNVVVLTCKDSGHVSDIAYLPSTR